MAVFRRIGDGPDDVGITSIESMCVSCGKTGTTQLLLTTIPHFKEVILMSFECPHCGYRNTEIRPGQAVQDRGCKYEVNILTTEDLNRQVVKSDSAIFRLEELDLEFPASGIGKLTTVEGLLVLALEDLKQVQSYGQIKEEEKSEKLDEVIAKLEQYATGENLPLTVSLDDPAGNSYIENPKFPKNDPEMKVTHYIRTEEQQKELGLLIQPIEENDGTQPFKEPEGSVLKTKTNRTSRLTLEKEVYSIPSECPNCRSPGRTEMCTTDIPFFKEIIIMAFNCDICGFRNNEVKGGGAISKLGRKMILHVPSKQQDSEAFSLDMSRDVVKSTSAGLAIPELELEITPGSLGGMYTTVEGLLKLARDRICDGEYAELATGDSAMPNTREKFEQFLNHFDDLIEGKMPFTFILDDPLNDSFLYSPTAPEPEPRLKTEDYERSFEQNEEFGLNDINTEDYDRAETKGVAIAIEHAESKKAMEDAHNRMRELQIGGKETHPHKDVVGEPTIDQE